MRGLEGSNVLFGFGSGLSEEPAVQDVEPVTLDEESFLSALPNPPLSVASGTGVVDEVPVDNVGDLALQRTDCFFGCLAFSDSAVVVDPARRLASELRDRDHMQRPVQSPVPFRVQPMPDSFP